MTEPFVGKPLPLIFQPKNYCDAATDWCLDVRFTGYCDSACSFCIAADDMKNKREFSMDAMVEAVVKTKSVHGLSILGGEPLLFPEQLLTFVERVKAEAPHIREFYLTTALPPVILRHRKVISKLFPHFDLINVSIQHWDFERNNAVLKTKTKANRIALLAELLREFPDEKLRVHLNLSREGIHTPAELHQALYGLRALGVKEVKVNELMNAPEDYISFESVTGMALPSPYAHGCSTFIDYFPELRINLKRSCFIVESSQSASPQDVLKLMWKKEAGYLDKSNDITPRVLYEDGTLAASWAGNPLG